MSNERLCHAKRPDVDFLEALLPQLESSNPSSPFTFSQLYLNLRLGRYGRYPIKYVNAAQCYCPADEQNLVSCAAWYAMLNQTQWAKNGILAAIMRKNFCLTGSGASWQSSLSRMSPGFFEELHDICIQMKLDPILQLLNFKSEKRVHDLPSGKVKPAA